MNKSQRKKIFLQVKNHLLAQNERSLDVCGRCVYRTIEGYSCAIGVLIKPKYYSCDIEGYGINNHEVKEVVQKSIGYILKDIDIDMLARLQELHDQFGTDDWALRLQAIEKEFFQ